MKYSIAALLTVVASVTAQSCPSCPTIIPLYRGENDQITDHFYTASATELSTSAGYLFEGAAAGIFPTQVGASVPLFRLFNSALGDHFYTTNTTERNAAVADGYVLEDSPGFVYTSQICASVPLYRLFLVDGTDHFYTTSASERARALTGDFPYTDQGIAAYVPVSGVIEGTTLC
ncbi:hypothetical protein GGX14DRAFT_473141 [Mycena pura]|uniref:DUF5648 domain-containing protein n=1 Tax=Mycena pura TaxID=153505 RepID=A0AAD6UWE5_9AGAR|nr:hypothetical protein GGX14DRAFT_473141 [Mycena pura]